MYRIEVSRELKALVLMLHGMQDGTEATMMKIDLTNRVKKLDETWTLILDFSGFEGTVPAAVKQQKLLAGVFSAASFRKRLLVPSTDTSLLAPFDTGSKYTVVDSFEAAWELAGGLARSIAIDPPADGTRFPANTFPPVAAK